MCDLCTSTGSAREDVQLTECLCRCDAKDLDHSPRRCRVCYHDLRTAHPDHR